MKSPDFGLVDEKSTGKRQIYSHSSNSCLRKRIFQGNELFLKYCRYIQRVFCQLELRFCIENGHVEVALIVRYQ